MRTYCTRIALVVACLSWVTVAAEAATIGFTPSSQSAMASDTVFVDVVVSELNGEIVSAYDLDITYDSTILTANTVVLTPALGNSFSFEAFYDSDITDPGVVDIAGLSLLSDAELLARQGGDSVVLATIGFHALSAGVSPLEYVFDAFNDIKGSNGLILPVTPEPGSVAVGVIPEPTAATLFLVGFAVSQGVLRRQASARK